MEVESFCGFAAVEGVAEDGKVSAGKVDADLVGTAGVQAAFEEEAGAAFHGDFFEDAEVCAGILAAAAFGHFAPLALLAFAGDAAHEHFYGELLIHPTLRLFDQGQILLCKLMALKKFRNFLIYGACFCKNNNPAGCAVQAVHYADVRRISQLRLPLP